MPTSPDQNRCRLLLAVDCGRDREVETDEWVYQGSRNQQVIKDSLRGLLEALPCEVVEFWGPKRPRRAWMRFCSGCIRGSRPAPRTPLSEIHS